MGDDEAPVYKTEVIYKTSDGRYFVSPDSIGRYWYDSVEEAREQHGDLPLRRATKHEAEWA